MFEFIQRFFGKPTSSATAKERLRLVLLSDHLSLAPDVVDALKHDLLEVISRYVEVDAANCDVTFEQREKQVAMLANIPILGMHARPRPTPPAAPPSAPPPPPAREPDPPPALDLGGATASVAAEPAPETAISAQTSGELDATTPQPVRSRSGAQNGGSRKRRRKRPAPAALPSPG